MAALESNQGQEEAEQAVQVCVVEFKQAMGRACKQAQANGSH